MVKIKHHPSLTMERKQLVAVNVCGAVNVLVTLWKHDPKKMLSEALFPWLVIAVMVFWCFVLGVM
jgi:hypothetical protein